MPDPNKIADREPKQWMKDFFDSIPKKKFEPQARQFSACGCRFENDYSSSVLLCEECSKLPCHNHGE